MVADVEVERVLTFRHHTPADVIFSSEAVENPRRYGVARNYRQRLREAIQVVEDLR